MSASAVIAVAQPNALVGEAVRMDGDDVIWVDPPNRRLLRWCVAEGVLREVALSMPLWSLAQRPDGSWVGAGEEGFCAIDVRNGAISVGEPAPLSAGCRLNDMVVDARGGMWAGSMHRGLLGGKGALYYAADVDAPVVQVADGLGVANGMAFVDDGTSLLVVDTLARTLLSYRRSGKDLTLAEPAVVTDFLGIPGKPDGMAIGPDGAVWVAMWGGACVVRLAANGAEDERVEIPAPHVGSLCFDRHGDAYVSTSRARLAEAMLQANPASGALFRVTFSR
jgi:sugar lactone lactonase YvrE